MTSLYSTYNNDQLLPLLKTGDHDAFTEIYNRYWDKMLFIAGVKCGSIAIAEEIVQDIFLDIWRRHAELEITGELEAYLAVSVKYRVINAQARLKRLLEYQQFEAGRQTAQDRSTEEWLSFQELQERLSQLVNRLPEKCRITYQLSREEGLPQKEVARRLNVTEKAVEANLSRALKILKTSLKNFLSVFFYF
ncbi:hypothetical protein A3860_21740 [Niastella vici]|uniref:RNA polymerase sigma factor 70 region 4 type 2 domain-containing protein n=1 Tax=Niastella vici TaxID=1703345 RepID=A0A1V9G099_9BACT|nr:sigma-70 family RNA polymerase sigma factor [Niastella vici]OQP64041.1 hypothetical protein A3860_21740 [Niastella vici]